MNNTASSARETLANMTAEAQNLEVRIFGVEQKLSSAREKMLAKTGVVDGLEKDLKAASLEEGRAKARMETLHAAR